jgi:hypothetical protein
MKNKSSGPRNVEADERKGPGRPKRATAPDAVPVTLRLSKEVYRQVQIVLLQRHDDRPVSRLVDELLSDWLKKEA